MRLSWHEIRTRASAFATEWATTGYQPDRTQLFYRDFFEIFGMPARRLAALGAPVQSLGKRRGYIDLFWKGVLLVEHKSKGRSLQKAKSQVLDYFPHLRESDLPRYLLLSDFQTFELHDLDEGAETSFALADLPDHVEDFGFVLGIQKSLPKDQDQASIGALDLVGKLYDVLSEAGRHGEELERCLVRLVFCLFADDTGIFEPRDAFADLLEHRTREDGSDLGRFLSEFFQVLNTPYDRRSEALDPDLAIFPYVDGDLFSERLLIHSFDKTMRRQLLDACGFDWSKISPAVFGSLFQSVMDKRQRRAQGAHYTTEKNILKVIEPLFLDDLRRKFTRLKSRRDSRRRSELTAFHKQLGELKLFDPACGCGNFLVIAYRELRLLEIEVIRELRAYIAVEGQHVIDAPALSLIDVDQFFGIEIGELPVRIAETALWMMDHIMNNRLSLEFGQTYVRIPLHASSHIAQGDALEIEWSAVVAPESCSYLLGNPPFAGAKYQSKAQRAQVRRIAGLGPSGGTLDYVAAWLLKAGEYLRSSPARVGFVATNSVTQGEQVAQLWPLLFDRYGLELSFAHRTFAWGSDARGMAHVHVVVVGLARAAEVPRSKRLFSYPDLKGEPRESRHAALSPYLFDAGTQLDPHLVVRETSRQLSGLPRMLSGSQPIDDGNYIFDAAEREAFLEAEPGAERFLRPFAGAKEYLHGGRRWILALQAARPDELKAMPRVVERIRAVRAFRKRSKRKSTLAIADFPTKYNVEVIPKAPFLVVPEVSSERRDYVPIAWMEPPVIPSNLVRIVKDASLSLFALLTSAMHMSWLRHVGGRLKSDFRYSIGLVYNTFPKPPAEDSSLAKLDSLAKAVLDAREGHGASTLADLYSPELMPSELGAAHRALDRAVDRLYRKKPFKSDRDRFEHLLDLYSKLLVPVNCNGNYRSKG